MTSKRIGFITHDPSFEELLGEHPTLRLLSKEPEGKPFYHEAGLHVPSKSSVYLTTNRLLGSREVDEDGKLEQESFVIKIDLDHLKPPTAEEVSAAYDNGSSSGSKVPGLLEPLEGYQRGLEALESSGQLFTSLKRDQIAMPNGGSPWTAGEVKVDRKDSSGDTVEPRILFCDQGRCSTKHDSRFISMSVEPPHETRVELGSGFQGKPFSSLNDVVFHVPSGCLFFTDPDYGVEQGFRRGDVEYAPNGVYVWSPSSGKVELIDDRFVKPNGVTFVPSDRQDPTNPTGTLYVTDTGHFRFKPNKGLGDLIAEREGPSRIYRYRVERDEIDPKGFKVDPTSREVFAESNVENGEGVPDGIHSDSFGNVWTGQGNGIHVHSSRGKRLGEILLPGGKGCANFCWAGVEDATGQGSKHRLLIFAEDELWEARIGVPGFD
ncbi:calcium-dependent phosphotriesterase [Violaceomyces palustris]|uniref:Calcium-dependent phosphotriesterase n=1 Tax=Violaceomyces palustris TaxID=1673888 RepID=A0ACD0P5D4_9BASI|nr:calcium-dependent phosphotriesterase [Violaceomyces palustris]